MAFHSDSQVGEPVTFLGDEIASGHFLAAPQRASVPLRPPRMVCGAIPDACELCGPLSVCASPSAPPARWAAPLAPPPARSLSTRLCPVIWEPLLTALAEGLSKPTDTGL